MPQRKRPPRLWLRPDTRTWFIKDGGARISTDCAEDNVAGAEAALAAHIAYKYEPRRGGRAAEVTVGEVLIVYFREKKDGTSRPKETEAAINRLNEFFGAMAVTDIRGATCRDFASHRKTVSGTRRDLEVLRAAMRYYHKEYGLDVMPAFTLPDKSPPRERYLTRPEAAALLWACMGWSKDADGKWTRRRDQKREHLARLVLIGLYTGTRLGAMLDLQWIRNTSGGWIDLDRGVIFRMADGERVAHNKRKTPVRIGRRLRLHLERWKRLDGWGAETAGIRFAIHYLGDPINKPHKAFRSARAAAGLDDSVTPHVLRHTRGTWLAQKNVPAREAAASLGLTEAEYERTYLHNDPDFQKNSADAY